MPHFGSSTIIDHAGAEQSTPRSGLLRQGMEALVCLALAVMLFRTFEVEGYMISTGSMAPSLLGFHKRAVCPSCGSLFAYGIPYDFPASSHDVEDDVPQNARATIARAGSSDHAHEPRQLACCPNCGLDAIDLAEVPRNQGDQLLVNKSAYDFRSPERWDVIVFRNPYRPSQAYVKRAIGLPGERVQIVDGDVYINGTISRKGFEKQRAIRIPVFNNDYVPESEESWKPRWIADNEPGLPRWNSDAHGFEIKSTAPKITVESSNPVSWVTYHQWRAHGGSHITTVSLLDGTPTIAIPEPLASPAKFDSAKRLLTCVGALSEQRFQELLAANPDPSSRQVIEELNRRSHAAPITDDYGYNHFDTGTIPLPVRDLMFEAELEIHSGAGMFVVEMTDGRQVFDCVIDAAKGEVRLHADGSMTPVRTAPLSGGAVGRAMQIEMSLFDRQVAVAIDGEEVFDAWVLSEGKLPPVEAPRRAVRFGGRSINASVQAISLYRDVYYTPGKGRNGVDSPCELSDDEYFVLGDNSPVSADSRNWARAGVPSRLLLGQPFVVHLPSRPGRIRLGGVAKHIRIPDFERMRYIR